MARQQSAPRFHRQPPTFWAALVEQYQASGLTLRAFCAQQQLRYLTFQGWRRRLARDAALTRKRPVLPVLARVHVTPAEPVASATPARYELLLRDARVVRLDAHFDAASLTRLLQTLEAL